MQKSFIETQFPVSKLSKESYKERKANHSQTLTGIGKWWGRKPLILVRATILALLMPASDNSKKDRDIFLKILTMDNDGLWRRKIKSIAVADLCEVLSEKDREQYFEIGGRNGGVKFRRGVSPEEKEALQRKVYETYTYDNKLNLCCRPEHLDGPDEATWVEINSYLGTNAANLTELIRELGVRRFGHNPIVGDAFCGGGSVPFEAARIGCDTYASDLNPVATLLTWSSLNIIGGGNEIASEILDAQKIVFDSVDKIVMEWAIETNEKGWRADSYLYCVETCCPECGWKVPVVPSWVIGEKRRTIGTIKPIPEEKRFEITIKSDVSVSEFNAAKKGTLVNSELICPNPDCCAPTPISTIRGDRRVEGVGTSNLRMWKADDFKSHPSDIFQERLYCIRWTETIYDENILDYESSPKTIQHYCSVTKEDLLREEKVVSILSEHFKEWQANGFLPDRKIEAGEKTDEPIRTRGWTYWHHLFTPRQLLIAYSDSIRPLFRQESGHCSGRKAATVPAGKRPAFR